MNRYDPAHFLYDNNNNDSYAFYLCCNRVNWESSLRTGWFNGSTTTTDASIHLNSTHIQYVNGSQDNPISFDAQRRQYMYAYAIIMLVVLYFVFQRAIIFFNMCLRASRKLHDKLFRGIIRAPMHFYNANSSGRIMNRFSKDIINIDTVLPMALFDSLTV